MEKEVLAALESYRSAFLAKDAPMLEVVLHPDLVYTHSNALHETKDDVLEGLPGAQTYKIEFLSPVVTIYGDMAMVKTDADFTNKVDGKDVTAHLNILHVFLKTDGHWRMLARQAVRRPVGQ